jgi:hypothetical protein
VAINQKNDYLLSKGRVVWPCLLLFLSFGNHRLADHLTIDDKWVKVLRIGSRPEGIPASASTVVPMKEN